MTDSKIITCENCGNTYAVLDSYCPVCNETNPLVVEDLLANELEEETLGRRPWWRSPLGCISIILFLGFIIGSIVLGGYDGLKERTISKQIKVSEHYQQALQHVENDEIDLAIAELGQTLTLNPAHSEAREMLRQLKSIQVETPTPTSETRQNVAEEMFSEIKALTLQGDWEGAIELLTQIRDIDPGFAPALISENLYTTYYELGLRLMAENNLPEALHAFDAALVERPNDLTVTAEWEKVSLYLSLTTSDSTDYEDNITVLDRLYDIDPNFADVKERLFSAYKNYGDFLAGQDDWCLAYPRYQAATELLADADLKALAVDAEFRCESARQPTSTPTVKPTIRVATTTPAASAKATATTAPPTTVARSQGKIYFSRLNFKDKLWEIIAVSPATGQEKVIVTNGAQPAIGPHNALLAYHSEASNSRGLHIFNLNTKKDLRVTTFNEDILPHWGGGNKDFVFASQRTGDRRWQIYLGFADGKGNAVPLQDGRTPALSPNDDVIAYQGHDAQGNKPGIYLIPKTGGNTTRLTTHQSDRSPAFSPQGDKIAFMSTQKGSWDIWIISTTGGKATPLITAPANDGLPVWSPDGTQLAFISDRDGTWGIYTVSAAGGQLTRVADWGGDHPDWLLEQLSWGR